MRPRARISGLLAALILLCVSLEARAQQTGKLPRLGWLGNYRADHPVYEGFREGLRAAFAPPQLLQTLPERSNASLTFRISF